MSDPMSAEEEVRVAVAKACGWTKFEPGTIQFTAQRSDGKWDMIPDYPNDLNACHEMEAHLGFIDTDGTLTIAYEANLRAVMKECGWPIWYATAKHRCEAFLRTFNLWKGASHE